MKRIKITQAFKQFLEKTNHLSEFFSYIIFTAQTIDEMRIHAVRTLAQIHEEEPKTEDLRKIATEKLKKYTKLILELWLCRLVECYENYLSFILKDVFICCPDILKSSETVKVDEILKYNTMEDFIKELTERKVSELSYSSFDDLYNFFDKKLGIKIVDNKGKSLIREAIEIRNISTHNNCIINRRYISKLNLDENLIGKRKDITAQYLEDVIEILHNNVRDIDSKLIKKFKLKNCRLITSEEIKSDKDILSS